MPSPMYQHKCCHARLHKVTPSLRITFLDTLHLLRPIPHRPLSFFFALSSALPNVSCLTVKRRTIVYRLFVLLAKRNCSKNTGESLLFPHWFLEGEQRFLRQL